MTVTYEISFIYDGSVYTAELPKKAAKYASRPDRLRVYAYDFYNRNFKDTYGDVEVDILQTDANGCEWWLDENAWVPTSKGGAKSPAPVTQPTAPVASAEHMPVVKKVEVKKLEVHYADVWK